MRGALAPSLCLVAALLLAGCMGRNAPVAIVSENSLDAAAYGASRAGDPAAIPVAYAQPAPEDFTEGFQTFCGT